MTSPPREIQDRYEILEEIGQGGMANVMKALQVSLGRVVAIKEIKSGFSGHPELLERFKREARTAASLIHENIVQVYNFGEPKQGSLFIVMEYVEGLDLKTVLNRYGPTPPRIAAFIGKGVAGALAYAHARGLIHRDVKPGNIMISNRGEIKLMDFGIVREMDSDLTRTGAFLGTPAYMSPEQLLGERLSPASDVFSLGVVLFEILTGEKPFSADSEVSLSQKVRTEKEKKVRSLSPEVPRRLQRIVHKCLAKAPAKRFASTEELIIALTKVLGPRSPEAVRREIVTWLTETSAVEGTMDLKPVSARPPSLRDLAAVQKNELDSLIKIKVRETGKAVIPPRKSTAEAADRVSSPPRSAKASARAPAPAAPGSRSETRVNSGDRLLKWLWWAILLAIAVLGAIIMFIIFEPESNSQDDRDKNVIERVLDKFRPSRAEEAPAGDEKPNQ